MARWAVNNLQLFKPTVLPNAVSVSWDPPLSPSEVQRLMQPRHRQ
jgi:hypothetical protein